MKLSEITPDITIAKMLNGNVKVQISAKSSRKVKAYAQAEQPQDVTDEEFITIMNNGVVESKTQKLGFLKGNLALTIYCKTNPNSTAKRNRINSMIEQCVNLINCQSNGGFYFELDATNVITPTTVNLTNGYATTVLNVKWHN